MSYLRKLLAVSALAVVAMALGASSAAAQETAVEAIDEASQVHCPAVTNVDHHVEGGCPIVAHGEEILLTNESAGITAVCESHWEARIDETGAGWIYGQEVITDSPTHPAPCRSEPCAEPDGTQLPWEIESMGETGGSPHSEHMTFEFCYINHVFGFESQTHCTIEVDFTQESHTHVLLEANLAECAENPNVHVTGTWEAQSDAAHPPIEIIHL